MKIVAISCFTSLVLATGTLYGQDVGFSQFYNQPLLRNPALAGLFASDARFTASYRNQWQSITVPYRTFAATAEIKYPTQLLNNSVTFTPAVQLMRDMAGTSEFSTIQAMPALNTSLALSDNAFLSVGVIGGLMEQRFDPTKLILNDQFVSGTNGTFSVRPVSSQVFDRTSVNYFDLSTGVSFSNSPTESTSYYVGAALFHVTQPSVGFFQGNKITLNKKIAFNGGFTTALPDDLTEITAYGDYFGQYDVKFHYVGISTFQVGLLVKRQILVTSDEGKYITAGLVYCWDDAIIPTLQLDINSFSLGVSYDVNINKMVSASQLRGGVELSLIFNSIFNARHNGAPEMKCPKFGRIPGDLSKRL